jgi:hypothetical protein
MRFRVRARSRHSTAADGAYRAARRRPAADFVAEEDRSALAAMLGEAAARQRDTGGEACTAHTRLHYLRSDGAPLPMDCRACTDGVYTYQAR